jgi:putative ABC transport system permease protein
MTTFFLPALLGIFVIVYGALGVMVVRRPLLGRLALREATRRPGQTAVLIVGLMIAGASIFAVQVFVDSADQAFVNATLAGWGRDDIEITAGGPHFDSGLAARMAADPTLAPNAASFQNAIILTTSVDDLDRNLGKPGVELMGLDMSNQQRFGAFTLSDGRQSAGVELTAGRVFITQPLADALSARAGDRLQVSVQGVPAGAPLVVAGIVQRTDAGAYGAYRSIFGSLETAQTVTGTSDVNLVRISARGDGDAEVARGTQMVDRLKALTSGDSLIVLETKRGALETEKQQAAGTRGAFTALSLIVALAASAMVVNLAVMLAEERRPRLAVLRALGLTRAGLVKLSVVEGAIYSLGGAVAGLPLGLAVGLVLNSILQPALAGTTGSSLVLAVQPGSLLGSIAAASLITLVTLFITSLRTSRMAISAAIRDLPEPTRARGTSWVRLGLLACGALVGGILVAAAGPPLRVVGGAIVIACAGGLIRGRLSDRARFTLIGAAIAAWGIGYTSLKVATWGTDNQVPGSMMGLTVTVAGLSVLLASNLRLLESIVRLPGRSASNLRATLRPALAYTSRRPLRAGLVFAAFGLIIALLTSLSASVTASRPNYVHDSGGFDVRVTEVGTSQLILPADVQKNINREEILSSRTFLGPIKFISNGLGANGDWQQQALTIFGLTDEQLSAGIMPLYSWDPKYQNAAEVWNAMRNDPSLVAGNYLSGAQINLATAQGTVHLTVVALSGNLGSAPSIINGLMVSQTIFDRLPSTTPGVDLLLQAAPGVTARELADQVQRATIGQGADATTTRQILDDSFAAGRGFVDLLLALVRVGLLVGVFSLGTIALRAVVERRRAIGVLRAIGFRPGQVLLGILLETILTATAGLAVGLGAAYGIGSSTLFGGLIHASFAPDTGTLWSAIGVVYAAVLLVTVLPAIRAARLRPAEALRTVG